MPVMRIHTCIMLRRCKHATETSGTELVKHSIQAMLQDGAEEVVLEAEINNSGALALYQNLGFMRDKRLQR